MTSSAPSPPGEGPLRLLGAVLAGGESRRFGRDKTAESVGGVPMVERAVETLEGLCEEVVVVSSRAATPKGRWRIVPDLRPGEGPLAGVEAALAEAEARGYDGALVLAADLPLVDGTTLARLVEAVGEGDAAAAATPVGGSEEDERTAEGSGDEERAAEGAEDALEARVGSADGGGTLPPFQPLCAVYRVACAEPAGRLLDEGRRDARALLEATGGRTVEVDRAVLLNVNEPEEIARVEETLAGVGSEGGSDGGSGSGSPERVVSLDAFRGVTIAAMILVNNPGSWSYVYPPLAHAAWHGWTPTDLIFPYFLFIVGVAIPYSFRRRLAEGADRMDLVRHIARRSAILIALGLAMRAVPDFDVATIRYYGVLQRIGLVYFAAATLYVYVGVRGRLAWTLGLLLGYWVLMTLVPVPGYGAGDLSPEGNLAAWLDRVVLDGHLWQDTWDPEGLLSTLPAVATSLLGIFTGEGLQSDRTAVEKTRGMLYAGVALSLAGWAWGLIFPINKNLWTSSYVVFTAGTALLALGAMYWLIDARRLRGAWQEWMVVYGRNAIVVFVASGMVSKAMARIRVGDGASLYGWIYENLFRSWAGAYPGSVAFAATYVLFWLAIMWILHVRRIYIRI